MMKPSAFRRWVWVHKWASLICTVFLLVTCFTGLPLLFKDEIAAVLDRGLPYAALPDDAPRASLNHLAASSRKVFPGETILSIFVDDDEPKVVVAMAPSWDAYRKNMGSAHWIKFDARTAQILNQSKPFNGDGPTFVDSVLRLHKDLFAGLPGELFMGLMALLLVVALVSGIAVYGPFMRRLDFGTVRKTRSRRLKWLDLHNVLGIVTVCWLTVAALTGFMNEMTKPLFGLWQQTDVASLLATFRGAPVPLESQLSPPQAAFDTAAAALPEMTPMSIIFPGSPFGSPYHYVVWTKGKQPLSARLFSPVLVDGKTGQMTAVLSMPWYLRALELSRPLHFGDYGGTPLKIIWAILDLITIGVLLSGLYLWFSRPGRSVDDIVHEAVQASRDPSGTAISHGAAE